MPTAAKLFAATLMALTGVLLVWLLRVNTPPQREMVIGIAVAALVGAISGWKACGARAGQGYGTAIMAGLRAAIYMVVGALIVLAIMEMFRLAWRRHYDTPTGAVIDIIALALGFGRPLLAPKLLGVLAAGGVLAGVMAEWAGRRWR
jgi:hypothetical protein